MSDTPPNPLHVRILTGLFMGTFMGFIMTGLITAINTGFDDGYLMRWMIAFVKSGPMAIILAILCGPYARNYAIKISTSIAKR